MDWNELWKFITDNAAALGVLLAIVSLISGAIGFSIKMIWEHFSKNTEKKSKLITELKTEVADLKIKINELQREADQYTLVKKSSEGDVLIQVETSTTICPICWNKDKNTIPLFDDGRGKYKCTICGHSGIYSFSVAEAARQNDINYVNRVNAMSKRTEQELNQKGWFN